jgi:hypothetical protein
MGDSPAFDGSGQSDPGLLSVVKTYKLDPLT